MQKLKDYLDDKSVAKFASDLDVDRTTVYYWIYGRSLPRPETIKRIESITNGAIRPGDWYV